MGLIRANTSGVGGNSSTYSVVTGSAKSSSAGSYTFNYNGQAFVISHRADYQVFRLTHNGTTTSIALKSTSVINSYSDVFDVSSGDTISITSSTSNDYDYDIVLIE